MKLTLVLVIFSIFIGQILALNRKSHPKIYYKIEKTDSVIEINNNLTIIIQFYNEVSGKIIDYTFENEDDFDSELGLIFSNKYANSETTEFTFKSNYLSKNELPSMKFSYTIDGSTKKEPIIVRLTKYYDYYIGHLIPVAVKVNPLTEKETPYEVIKNSILDVQLSNTDNCHWSLTNSDEVNDSTWIEYVENRFNSNCSRAIGEESDGKHCDGIQSLKLKIKSGDESSLQKLTFNKTCQDAQDADDQQSVDFTIKLKEECSMDGYKCCKINTSTIYKDSLGEWGVENGEWCFIALRDECYYSGYPCCTETDYNNYIYQDERNERWAVENGDWCFLLSIKNL